MKYLISAVILAISLCIGQAASSQVVAPTPLPQQNTYQSLSDEQLGIPPQLRNRGIVQANILGTYVAPNAQNYCPPKATCKRIYLDPTIGSTILQALEIIFGQQQTP